ncbi:MAG TPA: four helix bundle protein, partial [Opitutae bacterium]|nr:four helix bundle protein [Opitutae bacterium]
PDSEKFGLTSQFRRAAVSIPANIAEGYGKRSAADKARFYNIAQGPLNECRYYLRLTKDLGYADTQSFSNQLNEIGKMLRSYTNKVLSSWK